MKLERDRVTKQLIDVESRMSILKNNLKVVDVKMVEANDKKKHCLSTQHFHFAGILSN
jgi:hypothetical protein